MRIALAILAAAVAAAAQTSDLDAKLRRAVVHVQTVDRELERAQKLRQAGALVELRECRIYQPYTLVVSGVAITEREILTVALHPRADLRILVTYHDGHQVEAELVGTDPLSNLALISVKEPHADHLALGTGEVERDDTLRLVGYEVEGREARPVAVTGSVDRAQIPVPIRDLYGVTRCGSIVLGSSFAVATTEGQPNVGSACVDEEGKLVGLVVAGMPTRLVPDPDQAGRWTRVEIRFAVPAARLGRVVRDLRAHGRVIRSQFGIQFRGVDDTVRAHFDLPASAASLTFVQPDGPAARAGLQLHDILLAMDGKDYRDPHELGEAMSEKTPEQPVRFTVLRAGQRITLTAIPAEWK